MKVTLYTDPGCPFGFNAQRQELQLMWHYGHAAETERRMIVLSERSSSFEEAGLTQERLARGSEELAQRYGMPMGSEPVPRLAATIDACRAYVSARMHAPDRALTLLRALRRRAHSDQQPLDEIETITAAAADAGLAAGAIESWLADGDVEAALRADMAATRCPRRWRSRTGCRAARAAGATRRRRPSSSTTAGASSQPASSRSTSTRWRSGTSRPTSSGGRPRRPSTRSSRGRRTRPRPPRWPSCGAPRSSRCAVSSSVPARFAPSANDGYWEP